MTSKDYSVPKGEGVGVGGQWSVGARGLGRDERRELKYCLFTL